MSIDQILSLIHPLPKPLYNAACYALQNGKLLRPKLLLFTIESFNKDPKPALLPACALELVHTYSLIHDDLPAMDNDDFRRGRPSLHKAFSESIALLTGDYLLTYAFELLSTSPLPFSKKNALIVTLASLAGGDGMIAGQTIELENKKLSLEELYFLAEKKTSSLFIAAFSFAAILLNLSSLSDKFKELGRLLGLAYQIKDDLTDEKQDKEKNKQTTLET